MNVFEKIDALALSFFTKISHKFQLLTGKTNFFLANICLTVLAMWVTLNIINTFFPILTKGGNSFIFLLILGLYVYFISSDKNKLKKAEEAVFNSDGASLKTRFNLSSSGYILRVVFLLLSSLTIPFVFIIATEITPSKTAPIFDIINDSFSIAMTCYYYFVEVIPLPPGKSKVRQWLESFGKTPTLVPVKNK